MVTKQRSQGQKDPKPQLQEEDGEAYAGRRNRRDNG